MLYQRTVSKKFKVTGIGLHSGAKVVLTVNPAPPDFGICFKRSDLHDAPIIKAVASNISATENATTLGPGENKIHTVEHLMAVLYGLGIDNALCELDGPEVPIMDSSGAPFVFLIREAGISVQAKIKNFMVILKQITVEHEGKWARILPNKGLSINSTIVFPHPLIQTQSESFDFSCENFMDSIARARTFGLLKDVDRLKKKGLIKGGSLDNMQVHEYQAKFY